LAVALERLLNLPYDLLARRIGLEPDLVYDVSDTLQLSDGGFRELSLKFQLTSSLRVTRPWLTVTLVFLLGIRTRRARASTAGASDFAVGPFRAESNLDVVRHSPHSIHVLLRLSFHPDTRDETGESDDSVSHRHTEVGIRQLRFPKNCEVNVLPDSSLDLVMAAA
jgi:hypothetical protein